MLTGVARESRRRARLRGALGITIPFVICFGVLELFARSRVDPLPYRKPPQVRYDPHPVRTFTLRPCQQGVHTLAANVEIDCEGLRTHGRAERPHREGALRILALGDSFTFGWGVAGHETWPAQLEAQLDRMLDRPVEVQNAGTISYGVFQELDVLRERLAADPPDWVVHGLYWNDYQTAHPPREGEPSVLTEDGYFVWEPDTGDAGAARRALDWCTSRSSLLTFVRLVVGGSRLEPDDGGYGTAYFRFVRGELPLAEFDPIERFYEDVAALAGEYDFEVVSLSMPVVDLVGGAQADHPYPAWVAETLERHGIRGIDGFALWRDRGYGRGLFLSEGADAHLSPEGYRRLVEPVADLIAAAERR